jgi:hypothetical protein
MSANGRSPSATGYASFVEVKLALAHAVAERVRHARWLGGEEDMFVLCTPEYKHTQPSEMLSGPRWCELAGLPGAHWRSAIVLAADWQGFSAGQTLASLQEV